MVELVEQKSHIIIKRDGTHETFDPEKLRKVVLWATNDSEALTNDLLAAIKIKIHNKMHITKLYDEVISTASNMISDLYPVWEMVAKNLYLLKIHKDIGEKRADYPEYLKVVHNNIKHGFYDPELLAVVDLETIAKAINPEYDELFTFGGVNLFVSKYCNKLDAQLLELPQHVYMRVAIQEMYKDGTEAVIAKYHQIACHDITEATPKLVNSLKKNPQLFSCCLARPDDSLESINEIDNVLGKESKFGGGLATDFSAIRSKGSTVEGNKGKSGGIVPFIQKNQWSVGAYNQGNTRSSSEAMYYNWFHYEAPEITMLKDKSGKDEERARKLKYAVKWTKQFSEAILSNEEVYLFDPHKTQDMTFAWGDELRQLYDKYSTSRVRKRKYSARALAVTLAKLKASTGNNYTFFTDNANIQNIGGGVITQSNLCVTGDTKILTKDFGYVPIESVSGKTIDCWNGTEWSNTPIFQTSDGQEVLDVVLSNGHTIKATPYHKWYVIKQDTRGKLVGEEVKRTHELLPGDKLVKFDLEPITHGNTNLPLAYVNGFYTADGCYHDNKAKVYLYHGKRDLLPNFSGYSSINIQDSQKRVVLNYKSTLMPKYYVPDNSYNIQSRLDWLAGLFDGDGTLTNNNGTESIQLSSIEFGFIKELQLMLQELGVHSTISDGTPAGYRLMPSNDGSDTLKEFWCKKAYRLLIAGSSLNHLVQLGYTAYRVMPTIREYNREARQFIKVTCVVDNNEVAATFCGTEPKANKLMFNGVLTGNCMEYLPNFKPITHVSSKLVDEKVVHTFEGDIALCNLSSINLANWVTKSSAEKFKTMKVLVRSMNNCIDNSFYSNSYGEHHSFNHRNLGIGVSNYANLLASMGLRWEDEGARRLTHEVFEEISYMAIRCSVYEAMNYGPYPLYANSKWATGIFPHELSILPEEFQYPLLQDWETLRAELQTYGIRNEYLLAIAPTATSGLCINATPGVDAPLKLKTIEEGTYSLPFVVPNLKQNREFYQTRYQVSNTANIELAAIRQRFVDMGQSVSLAYRNPESAYDIVKDIMYAETLGLKTLYYTNTPAADDLSEDEVCESCSS